MASSYRQLVYRISQQISTADLQTLVYIRLHHCRQLYRDESALIVLSKLEMDGVFSASNPAGLIQVAKDIDRWDLVNLVKEFMKRSKPGRNQGHLLYAALLDSSTGSEEYQQGVQPEKLSGLPPEKAGIESSLLQHLQQLQQLLQLLRQHFQELHQLLQQKRLQLQQRKEQHEQQLLQRDLDDEMTLYACGTLSPGTLRKKITGDKKELREMIFQKADLSNHRKKMADMMLYKISRFKEQILKEVLENPTDFPFSTVLIMINMLVYQFSLFVYHTHHFPYYCG